MKKSIFVFSFILFLIVILISLASAGPSTWCEGATYNFTCGEPINQSCTLTGNVSINDSSCFQVRGTAFTDTLIDCNGYWIIGNDYGGTHGIKIIALGQRVTIQNCIISDFEKGIHSEGTNSIGIFNNIATSNEEGFYFINAERNNVSWNIAYDNRRTGFSIDSGSRNLDFYENEAYNNGDTGAYFSADSFGTDFVDNTLYNNKYGLTLYQTNGTKFLETI